MIKYIDKPIVQFAYTMLSVGTPSWSPMLSLGSHQVGTRVKSMFSHAKDFSGLSSK